MTPSPTAVNDDDPSWPHLRLTHFYINDLFFRETEPMGIGVPERRYLDALSFARKRGAGQGVTVGTLCGLMPPATKTTTAVSLLERLEAAGWVEARKPADGKRGRLWRLTDEGADRRTEYNPIAENIFRKVYAGSTEELDILKRMGQSASTSRESRLSPIVGRVVDGRVDKHVHEPDWAALRRAHFYISDLFYHAAEPVGVGPIERRILDSLGFARQEGRLDGVTVATLCKLIQPDTQPQTVSSALSRMSERNGWIAPEELSDAADRRRGRRWRLTEKGDKVRAFYKTAIEDILRDVHNGAEPEDQATLLRLARSGVQFRDDRLRPILEFAPDL